MSNTWASVDILPQRHIFNNLVLEKKYTYTEYPLNLDNDYSYNVLVSLDKIVYLDNRPNYYIEMFDNRVEVTQDKYGFIVNYVGKAPIDTKKSSFSVFVIGEKKYKFIAGQGGWRTLPTPKTMEICEVTEENPRFKLNAQKNTSPKFFISPSFITFGDDCYTPTVNVEVKKGVTDYYLDFGTERVSQGKSFFKQSSRQNRYTPIKNYPISFPVPYDFTKTTCPFITTIVISPPKNDIQLGGTQPLFKVVFDYQDDSREEQILSHDFSNKNYIYEKIYQKFPKMTQHDEDLIYPTNPYERIGGLKAYICRHLNLVSWYSIATNLKLKKPAKKITLSVINSKLQTNYMEGGYQYEYTLYVDWFGIEDSVATIKKTNNIARKFKVVSLYE